MREFVPIALRVMLGIPNFSPASLNAEHGKFDTNSLLQELDALAGVGDIDRMVKLLLKFEQVVYYYDVKSEVPESAKLREKLLAAIVRILKQILEPYAKEANYPRNPFDLIEDEETCLQILFAVSCYLLRGYCSFCTAKSELGQDISTAKEGLNDFTQAYYLIWRLAEAHARSGRHPAGLNQIIAALNDDKVLNNQFEYGDLIQLLNAISNDLNGSVFDRLYYFTEARRYFREAVSIFEKFKPCKTALKAKYELAKIEIQLGDFLEGARHCFEALQGLMRLQDPDIRRKQHKTLEIMQTILGELKKINQWPIWERERIYSLMRKFDPSEFKKEGLIGRQHIHLAMEILVRIGYVHVLIFGKLVYRITRPELSAHPEDDEKNKEYFAPWLWEDRTWSSSMGQYCLLFFGVSSRGNPFQEEPERLLAYYTSQAFKDAKTSGDLTAQNASIHLGRVAMDEITNVVTAHQMIHQFLLKGGYKSRMKQKEEEWRPHRSYTDKFVVLRRFQSFNPQVPRPRDMKILGGGYFLFWRGKGTVIDPGYDFLQNFFSEGFALDDIDAVVITHSHPDHDEQLSTILTMIAEWNDFWKKNFREDKVKKIDLFLNEGSYRKYVNWIYSPNVVVRKVYQLQLNARRGRKPDTRPWEYYSQQENCRLDLLEEYHYVLEVVPAWHDEIIAQTSAIGLIFHLHRPASAARGEGKDFRLKLGITSDTYGYHCIGEQYKGCDVLVAHIGDLKAAELLKLMDPLFPNQKRRILDLVKDGYLHGAIEQERIKNFVTLIESLDLVNNEVLAKEEIEILTHFIRRPGDIPKLEIRSILKERIIHILDRLAASCKTDSQAIQNIKREIEEMLKGDAKPGEESKEKSLDLEYLIEQLRELRRLKVLDLDDKEFKNLEGSLHMLAGSDEDLRKMVARIVIKLIGDVSEYHYPHHLGLEGVFYLFLKLRAEVHERRNRKEKPGEEFYSKLLILGEFPEELGSYRHMLARVINEMQDQVPIENQEIPQERRRSEYPHWPVRCLTGDIGLHVGFGVKKAERDEPLPMAIRCFRCNQNNEAIARNLHYHEPTRIQETMLKRMDQAMVYLCSTYDHASLDFDKPRYFLSSVDIRQIR